jgi:hypothetical protein
MLSQQQAKALAHFVATLRPDWNAEGIYAALGKCRDRDPFATSLAAIRAAWDDGARTPGVIPTDGPHWREMAGEVPKVAPRSYNVPCPFHAGEVLPCGRCAAATAPSGVARMHLTQARAELTAARGRCCSHGVERSRCREDHPDPTDQPDAEEATDHA